MRRAMLLTLTLSVLAVGVPEGAAAGGDAAAGKAKAAMCAGCHGPKGISTNALWPNLAGQKEKYLLVQLKAIKSGKRDVPIMKPIVASMSEDDLENLAAYFASLDCKG